MASCLNNRSAYALAPDARSLRTRAIRYRLLAETLFDPEVIQVVLASARELEMEAALIDDGVGSEDASLIGFRLPATQMPGRNRAEDI